MDRVSQERLGQLQEMERLLVPGPMQPQPPQPAPARGLGAGSLLRGSVESLDASDLEPRALTPQPQQKQGMASSTAGNRYGFDDYMQRFSPAASPSKQREPEEEPSGLVLLDPLQALKDLAQRLRGQSEIAKSRWGSELRASTDPAAPVAANHAATSRRSAQEREPTAPLEAPQDPVRQQQRPEVPLVLPFGRQPWEVALVRAQRSASGLDVTDPTVSSLDLSTSGTRHSAEQPVAQPPPQQQRFEEEEERAASPVVSGPSTQLLREEGRAQQEASLESVFATLASISAPSLGIDFATLVDPTPAAGRLPSCLPPCTFLQPWPSPGLLMPLPPTFRPRVTATARPGPASQRLSSACSSAEAATAGS